MSKDKKTKPVQNTGKKIEKARTTPDISTTAGEYLAKTWAYGTSGLQLIQELDSIVTALANIDFSDTANCKGVKPLKSKSDEPFEFWKETGEFFADAGKAIPACAPFLNDDFADESKDTAEIVLESVMGAINFLVNAEDRFPACAEEQLRRFLAIIPVQYYLLLLLSKVSEKVADFDAIAKQIDTPCGTSFEQVREYKSRIPQIEIPLIPQLPYIRIPSITDNAKRFLYELICVGICATTTAIIQRVAPLLTEGGDELKNYLFGEDPENIVSLRKVPILPYITPAAIDGARDNALFPFKITNEQVRKYIQKIQDREDIGQEEFIFLFLGQTNCNIISKIQDEEDTAGLFKFDSDSKIKTFFSYLGSFINFIDLLENSKGEICAPDPCDIKPNELEGILSTINDLCALLNPATGLPPLPLGSLMSATGANDFIVDNTYESYSLIPKNSNLYQDYINDFYLAAISVVEKLLVLKSEGGNFFAIQLDADKAVLGQFSIEAKFDFPTIKIEVNLKQQVLEDKVLNFSKLNKIIQNYWIDDPPLAFKNDKFLISNLNVKSSKSETQDLFDFARRYLEASFPFTVISLAVTPPNSDFATYYDGWAKNDSELFAETTSSVYNPGSLTVKFDGYLKYTKPILKKQLEGLQQGVKADTNTGDGLEENFKFAALKQDFGL